MKIFFNGSQVDIICHQFRRSHQFFFSTLEKKGSLTHLHPYMLLPGLTLNYSSTCQFLAQKSTFLPKYILTWLQKSNLVRFSIQKQISRPKLYCTIFPSYAIAVLPPIRLHYYCNCYLLVLLLLTWLYATNQKFY